MNPPTPSQGPSIISIKKIWDRSPHNALTDLIRFNGQWFCTFRESNKHVYGKDGEIRIIASPDGEVWTSAAVFTEEEIDLRDPKLSVTPEGKLMLLAGGTQYKGKRYISRQPRVSFSEDGFHWSPLQTILYPHEWLWRITWHRGIGYGAAYSFADPKTPRGEWILNLFSTQDGIAYNHVKRWEICGNPNETTIRFDQNERMIALVRRELRPGNVCWIGTSAPPYEEWTWHSTSHHLGGPNFLILPSGEMWAAGRIVERNPYGFFEQTALASMTLEDLFPKLYLSTGGEDCSYPGMVYHQGKLWISYYSSHEGTTAIYLAKIQLPPQK